MTEVFSPFPRAEVRILRTHAIPEWVDLYLKVNRLFVMSPQANDIGLLHGFLGWTRDGSWSAQDYASSTLGDDQLDEIAKATTLAHIHRHVPFLIEGNEALATDTIRPTLQKVLETQSHHLPRSKRASYPINPDLGSYIVPKEVFQTAYEGIRNRIFTITLNFMEKNGMYTPSQPLKVQTNAVSQENAGCIGYFLTSRETRAQRDQFAHLVRGAASVMFPRIDQGLSTGQAGRYDVKKAGHMGFRDTPEQQEFLRRVRGGINAAYREIAPFAVIKKSSKDRLMHDLTLGPAIPA